MVYVLSQEGKPLIPTERHGKVRRMLKEGKAKVVKAKPFTIQLMYETTEYTQPATLGLDSGYSNVGFSAVNAAKEWIAGELSLLQCQVERNKERSRYRRQRRSRLRYRKARFNNRKKPEGWLAPSLQNKLDTHIRLVDKISALVPISKVVVEVAAFDIQEIKNPNIEGKGYQQGEQYGFWNLREYIFHRDNHQCQNPDCKNKAKEKVLQVHHIGFWKGDRTDRPGNLITLCTKCHTPANHQSGKFLYGWEPKVKSYKPETFMSVVRWKLVNAIGCEHTYGHITKTLRIESGLEKSHVNDAFCIAGGTSQQRVDPLQIKQIRRNNRSLELFYDARYIDIRTGEKVSGGELFSGRRARNINLNGPNLRIYRGKKMSKGQRRIRKTRYAYQPCDTVLFNNQKYAVKGIQNKGVYIKLKDLAKPVKTELVSPL
ncbi:hypothetical protein CEB3_c05060 [Peptococcaceae bacterium CEB3]|nr:hypothetical protein CEB3_c05060 [Peptococcaceae bacterium CEB3]